MQPTQKNNHVLNGQQHSPKIQERSESARDFIMHKPGFITRWAVMIFVFIFILLFTGTWFIHYPDTLYAQASITSNNAPKEVVTVVEGKLTGIFVKNEQRVKEGETIAWIESTANHQEVLRLTHLIDKSASLLDAGNAGQLFNLYKKERFKNLGDLQPFFQQFMAALQQFNDYLLNGYYPKKKRSLTEEYALLKQMHEALLQQKTILGQDIQLAEESFGVNNKLHTEKVISAQDYREAQSKLLAKKMTLPQLESSLLSNEGLQSVKWQEITALEHDIAQQKMLFQQSLQTMKSAIAEWMKKYVIKAPIAGTVVFMVPVQKDQYIYPRKIGYINPDSSEYYAEVVLPQNNFGRTAVGQKVQLRLVGYPFEEYGYVEGKLAYISKIPTDSGFLANIALLKGLTTNYHTKIQYRNGLKADALIITRDERLIHRFYYNIIKLFRERSH